MFNSQELRALGRLKTPAHVQGFLDDLSYNRRSTCRSPRRVLRDGTAHCMEGALLAAAALRVGGFEPLLVDLEAVNDEDHVLAVYRVHGHWGAVAKSNYTGLRFREPVYRTLRELVMSYFEHYFNRRGSKTLRRFSRPVNLKRFDGIGWMTAEKNLWEIPEYLVDVEHRPVLTPAMERRLCPMDRRLYAAGRLGSVE